jgi:glycosyltransferase involved in cell wall biosynthesis
MIVDFRDLWSEHHVPGRFTDKQRKQIHHIEKKLLANSALVSAPQKHMVTLLRKWVTAPVYLLSHSAYVDTSWEDGRVISDEFTMLYAGKLYPGGPGLGMLLELIRKLSRAQLYKPVKCHFFVDDVETLHGLAKTYGVESYITVHGWVSPSVLWNNMRSAHVLIIPDAGVAENFHLLPTKTFQYAHTGRQILSFSPFKNPEMQAFLEHFNAGLFCTSVDEAANWATQLSFQKSLYEALPQLRKVAMRTDVAVEFGAEIEKVLAGK